MIKDGEIAFGSYEYGGFHVPTLKISLQASEINFVSDLRCKSKTEAAEICELIHKLLCLGSDDWVFDKEGRADVKYFKKKKEGLQ